MTESNIRLKGIIIAFGILVILAACTREPERIVSDTPVTDVIMGSVLCEPVSRTAILRAFEQAGMTDVTVENISSGSSGGFRVVAPSDDGISYAGCNWDYADFCRDASGDLYAVVFENHFDSGKQAKMQFKKVAGLMESKHGKANLSKSKGSCTTMWTDDTNSVGVSFHKSIPENGKGKWTCMLYYVNIARYNSL